MVYQYSKRLSSTVIKELYNIRTPDKAICMFLWIFSDLMVRANNKTRHKQMISNWYKY